MDITPIINAVIALIAALISAFVIPWLKRKMAAIDTAQLEAWVKIGVSAAEQAIRQMVDEVLTELATQPQRAGRNGQSAA